MADNKTTPANRVGEECNELLSNVDLCIEEAMASISRITAIEAPKLEVPKKPKARAVPSRYMQPSSKPAISAGLASEARESNPPATSASSKTQSRLSLSGPTPMAKKNGSAPVRPSDKLAAVSNQSHSKVVKPPKPAPTVHKPPTDTSKPAPSRKNTAELIIKPPLPKRGSPPDKSKPPLLRPKSIPPLPTKGHLHHPGAPGDLPKANSSFSSPTKTRPFLSQPTSPLPRSINPESPGSVVSKSVPVSPHGRSPSQGFKNVPRVPAKSRAVSGPIGRRLSAVGPSTDSRSSFSQPFSPDSATKGRIHGRAASDISPASKITIHGEEGASLRSRGKAKSLKHLTLQEWETLCMVMHNRELQWRFLNWNFEISAKKREAHAEHQVWGAIERLHQLRTQVSDREKLAKDLVLAHKMNSFVNLQQPALHEWGRVKDDQFESAVSTLEAMHGSTARVPLVRGVKAEVGAVRESLEDSEKVLQDSADVVSHLLPKAVTVAESISQLSSVALELQATVKKCNDALAVLRHKQLHERSLRGHLHQLTREGRS